MRNIQKKEKLKLYKNNFNYIKEFIKINEYIDSKLFLEYNKTLYDINYIQNKTTNTKFKEFLNNYKKNLEDRKIIFDKLKKKNKINNTLLEIKNKIAEKKIYLLNYLRNLDILDSLKNKIYNQNINDDKLITQIDNYKNDILQIKEKLLEKAKIEKCKSYDIDKIDNFKNENCDELLQDRNKKLEFKFKTTNLKNKDRNYSNIDCSKYDNKKDCNSKNNFCSWNNNKCSDFNCQDLNFKNFIDRDPDLFKIHLLCDKYKLKYNEKPNLSLKLKDCIDYANSKNYIIDQTFKNENKPKGCFIESSSGKNYVYYNNTSSNDIDCTNNSKCIEENKSCKWEDRLSSFSLRDTKSQVYSKYVDKLFTGDKKTYSCEDKLESYQNKNNYKCYPLSLDDAKINNIFSSDNKNILFKEINKKDNKNELSNLICNKDKYCIFKDNDCSNKYNIPNNVNKNILIKQRTFFEWIDGDYGYFSLFKPNKYKNLNKKLQKNKKYIYRITPVSNKIEYNSKTIEISI